MKALTIWQPWASLIVAGAKPYEFRGWRVPRSLIGQRIVIHAAARKIDTENRYRRKLAYDDAAPEVRPAILATAKLEHRVRQLRRREPVSNPDKLMGVKP